jgi:hypothetical protein
VHAVAFNTSPLDLDRALARAAGQWRSWKLRLRTDRDAEEAREDEPLEPFRNITGQSAFQELAELRQDPLRVPFQRWVLRLAEQRVNHEILTRLESERRKPREMPDAPLRGSVSIADLLRNGLADAPRSAIWFRLFLQHAAPVSAHSVELWQRRREFTRRMGIDPAAPLDAVFAPATPSTEAAPLGAAPPRAPSLPAPVKMPLEGGLAAGLGLARRLSAVTRERIRELGARGPAELFACALGRDVPGDWPARLTPERLRDYFRGGDLLRSLELQGEPLPASLGAASSCRALSILGSAWHEALAPTDQPFVVAHDAYGLGRHEAGALFALLPLNAGFLLRHLGVSKHALGDVQRRVAQLWLIDLASAAFRVQLHGPALGGERGFREEFAELASRELSISLPREVAGAVLQLGVEDEQRLVGRLLAARRAQELTDAHDEDWFRNPRAIEQLRAEARRPPAFHAAPEAAEEALGLVTRQLEKLLR